MSYTWRILRSAVEQEILFPSKEAYKAYIKRLDEKGLTYEVLDETTTAAEEVIAIMRKPYNNNLFLAGRASRKYKKHAA